MRYHLLEKVRGLEIGSNYKKEDRMNVNLTNVAIEPILALLIGILILLVPGFLNYFVAVYLIVIGILGLMRR